MEKCAHLTQKVVLPVLLACDSDDRRVRNRYLPDYNFVLDIDFTLPLYTRLRYPSDPVFIDIAGKGINGVIVMNTGGGFMAFEASCPNQPLTDCSRLTLDGINAVCPCDDVAYNLFTGLATTKVEYPLKSYRVEIVSADFIRVHN